MEIKRIDSETIEALMNLWVRCQDETQVNPSMIILNDYEPMKQHFLTDAVVYGAFSEDGVLMGYLVADPDKRIRQLYVIRSERRHKIATRLVQKALEDDFERLLLVSEKDALMHRLAQQSGFSEQGFVIERQQRYLVMKHHGKRH